MTRRHSGLNGTPATRLAGSESCRRDMYFDADGIFIFGAVPLIKWAPGTGNAAATAAGRNMELRAHHGCRRAEAWTVIRSGPQRSGTGTATRRNGAGGCPARRIVHRGATGAIMASRRPFQGLLTCARACRRTEGVRRVRWCPEKRARAIGCGGLRVVQGRYPWSRLTRDNCSYRESNRQFGVPGRRPRHRPRRDGTILDRPAAQFNPVDSIARLSPPRRAARIARLNPHPDANAARRI